MPTVLQGICKGGPLDGKIRTSSEGRKMVPAGADASAGFYIHQPAQGPTPAAWKWIEGNKEKSNGPQDTNR